MRESWNGFDKYIPREDHWPKRVWDWPIPLPYRQAVRLRDTIWLGGQVPSEPGNNSGRRILDSELLPQTRFTMSYIEDLVTATSGRLWLQAYIFRERKISDRLIDRAANAGIDFVEYHAIRVGGFSHSNLDGQAYPRQFTA